MADETSVPESLADNQDTSTDESISPEVLAEVENALSGTEEPVEDAQPEGKVPYTPEELSELLKTEGTIDTDRLSNEGKLLMKSFQKGLDHKFKGVAEKEKQIERDRLEQSRIDGQRRADEQRQRELANNPKEQYFDKYMRNPPVIINEINAEIQKLERVSPRDEDAYLQAREAIASLTAVKDEFAIRREGYTNQRNYVDSLKSKALESARGAISNFDTKSGDLMKFATEEMGMPEQMVYHFTDPAIQGLEGATEALKFINKMYDKMNAGKTAEGKLKKTSPKPLVKPGSTPTTPAVGRIKGNAQALEQKAIKSGRSEDWTAYLQAIGIGG